MLKTTTARNRWKIFPSVPYPHVITFCLVWQHHDVLQTSATASKRLRIGPKGCILLQHFETTCVRNVLIVKYPEQQIYTGWLGVIQLVLCYCISCIVVTCPLETFTSYKQVEYEYWVYLQCSVFVFSLGCWLFLNGIFVLFLLLLFFFFLFFFWPLETDLFYYIFLHFSCILLTEYS